MCGVRTCATTRRDAFEFEHAIIVILPLSLLPPPPSPFFSRAKFELNVRTTDNGPANSVGPPTEGARYPAAVVTQRLSFFCFLFVFSSHLFIRRETVLRAYHSPVPHHPGATASPHVASRHPSPAATPAASPRRGSTLLLRPWYASPRHVTSHPHPILLPRNDALWGPPHSRPHSSRRPSVLGHHTTTVRKTRRLASPHHRGATSPRHAAPPRCTSPACRHLHAASPDTPTMPLLLPPPAALGHHPTLCTSSCM